MLNQIPAPMIGALLGLFVFGGLILTAMGFNVQARPPALAQPPPVSSEPPAGWHDRLDDLIDNWLADKDDSWLTDRDDLVSDPVPDHEHPPGYRPKHASTEATPA